MNRRFFYAILVVLVSLTTSASSVYAAVVTDSVGTQVASDADVLLITEWVTAVGGASLADPTHDANNGINGFDDNVNTSYSGSWTFNYAPVVEPLQSATLSFGIFDHDSAASGDQVASFVVDGVNLTAELNAIMNATGGRVFPTIPPFRSEYNVYSINLPNTTFIALADGSATVSLNLQNGFAALATTNNSGAVDFSTLTVTSVPEASSFAILSFGCMVSSFLRLRRRAGSRRKKAEVDG